MVKSTVPVGTNDKVEQYIHDFLPHKADQKRKFKVDVASNPEFLAQGTAVRDTLEAPRIVIGTESKWAEEMLMKIYEPFGLPIVSVDRRSAEMIKYASNDFLALKISYINEIANLCERVGADIDDVALGMSFDERIGSKYLDAGIGYGGSCFPKDTKALEYLAKQHGYELHTIRAAIHVNKYQQTILYKKACKRLVAFNGLKVAVLGLTFKPGTDDLREAPSLATIPLLLEQGADIHAYDPAGMEHFKKKYPEGRHGQGTMQYGDIETVLQDADVCFILTEWREIRSIRPRDYVRLMRTPLIYDGRNLYDVYEMKAARIEYYSVGRQQ